MTFSPSAHPVRLPPNRIIGGLLNVVLPGAGFTYFNKPGWHLGWIGILLASSVIGVLLSIVLQARAVLLLPVMAYLVMHAQYFVLFNNKTSVAPAPGLENGLKWGLIAGHAGIGIFGLIPLIGILAAVILPNLLGARERANSTAVMFYMRQVQIQAYGSSLGGAAYNGPCAGVKDVTAAPKSVRSCTVTTVNNTDPPALSVQTVDGKTYTLP